MLAGGTEGSGGFGCLNIGTASGSKTGTLSIIEEAHGTAALADTNALSCAYSESITSSKTYYVNVMSQGASPKISDLESLGRGGQVSYTIITTK
jgi:hypothetical protein